MAKEFELPFSTKQVVDKLNRVDEIQDGKSAYDVAVDNGFKGSEEEWLLSLKGEKGDKGADGTMIFADLTDEQKASLKGDKGDRGSSGVYVGSGDMPEDCNVQIDPNGSSVEISAPEYIEVINGETKLTEKDCHYVFKTTYNHKTPDGEYVLIKGKDKSVLPAEAKLLAPEYLQAMYIQAAGLWDDCCFNYRKGINTEYPDAAGYTYESDTVQLKFCVPEILDGNTGELISYTSDDTVWACSARKVSVPNMFIIELPEHNLTESSDDGVGFFLIQSLDCTKFDSTQGFLPGRTSLSEKIVNKDQNMILFMFTPCYENNEYLYNLKVTSVNKGIVYDYKVPTSYRVESGGHVISISEDMSISVDMEVRLCELDSDKYIKPIHIPEFVTDYEKRAYVGVVISNVENSQFETTISLPTNELLLEIKLLFNNLDPHLLNTSGYTKEDTMPQARNNSPKLYYKDINNVARIIEYIKEEDTQDFWNNSTCLSKDGCIAKDIDNKWKLFTKHLDGTPVIFELSESANNVLNNYKVYSAPEKGVVLSVEDKEYLIGNSEGNFVGADVINYTKQHVSKLILWDGSDNNYHLCDFKTFDDKLCSTNIHIAEDGTVSWKNSFDNGFDGAKTLAVCKLVELSLKEMGVHKS